MRVNGVTIAISGAILAIAGAGVQHDGQHQDTREAIKLPAMRRDMVLTEMRGLLTSVNGILRGLAAGDTALMRQAASKAGMAAMSPGEGMGMMPGGRGMGRGGGMGAGMGPMMPEGFRRLGHETHVAFDSLAARIAARAPADTVIARLARITDNCLTCHAAYRLEVLPPE